MSAKLDRNRSQLYPDSDDSCYHHIRYNFYL